MYQPHKFAMRPGMAQGGLGSFLGGLVKKATSIIPGPAGMIAKAAHRVIQPSQYQSSTRPPPTSVPTPTAVTSSFTGIRSPFISAGRETTTTQRYFADAPGMINGSGTDGCPKGHRLNRTGYFLKSGEYVPPRSRCVKIRTRNVANGKALRKAISRAGSFEKMVRRNRKNLRALAKV